LRPKSSSISSSFEVRKNHRQIGFLTQTAQQFHAVHARHLDVEDGDVRRIGGKARQSRRAIRVGLDVIAFGLKGHTYRSQNVAVIVNQRDGWHWPPSLFKSVVSNSVHPRVPSAGAGPRPAS